MPGLRSPHDRTVPAGEHSARFATGSDFGGARLSWVDRIFTAYVELFLTDRCYLFDPTGFCPPMGIGAAGNRTRRGRRIGGYDLGPVVVHFRRYSDQRTTIHAGMTLPGGPRGAVAYPSRQRKEPIIRRSGQVFGGRFAREEQHGRSKQSPVAQYGISK